MRDLHQSGRFDATEKEQQRLWDEILPVTSMCSITESRHFSTPVGWESTKGETRLFWNPRIWKCVTSFNYTIPTPPWVRGGEHLSGLTVPVGVFERIYKPMTLIRVAGHHPAHLDRDANEAANEAVLDQIGDFFNKMISQNVRREGKDRKPVIFTYTADFNKDLNRREVRHELLHTLPSLSEQGFHFNLFLPEVPTFGKRTIDGIVTSGTAHFIEPIKKVRGFDHRGFSFKVYPW